MLNFLVPMLWCYGFEALGFLFRCGFAKSALVSNCLPVFFGTALSWLVELLKSASNLDYKAQNLSARLFWPFILSCLQNPGFFLTVLYRFFFSFLPSLFWWTSPVPCQFVRLFGPSVVTSSLLLSPWWSSYQRSHVLYLTSLFDLSRSSSPLGVQTFASSPPPLPVVPSFLLQVPLSDTLFPPRSGVLFSSLNGLRCYGGNHSKDLLFPVPVIISSLSFGLIPTMAANLSVSDVLFDW